MKIDKDIIENVSRLARIDLTEDEKAEFSAQLSDIIDYVEKIEELDTAKTKPADHIMEMQNIFRNDHAEKSIDRSEIEKMAPQFSGGHIIVPRIIEDVE